MDFCYKMVDFCNLVFFVVGKQVFLSLEPLSISFYKLGEGLYPTYSKTCSIYIYIYFIRNYKL